MVTQPIENIRKKFHNEWLLIRVVKLDKTTTTPLAGRLLAHSQNRDKIYSESLKYKGMILIDYSEDKLAKGYAVAF